MHIPNGWPQFANAVLFGVLTALIAIRTGGIAFTYGMHLVNNLFRRDRRWSRRTTCSRARPASSPSTTPGLLWWDVASGVVPLAIPALAGAQPAGRVSARGSVRLEEP